MILCDLNPVLISNYMIQVGNHSNVPVDENLFRHMALNSIRGYKKKFGSEYGEFVIACDGMGSWRKKVFPYYKARRSASRKESPIDWTALFNSLNKVQSELKEYFPYKVIQVQDAEADDIIGVLASEFGNTSEKIMILSGDKDFIQLQEYMNVKQYNPVLKKMVTHNNPAEYLREHIIKGESGENDGIPNILSRDDTFVIGTRSKPIFAKNLEQWVKMAPEEFCDENMLRNWKRNQQLVDLSFTPQYIKDEIMEQYKQQPINDRDKLFNYFVQNRLSNLISDIGDF